MTNEESAALFQSVVDEVRRIDAELLQFTNDPDVKRIITEAETSAINSLAGFLGINPKEEMNMTSKSNIAQALLTNPNVTKKEEEEMREKERFYQQVPEVLLEKGIPVTEFRQMANWLTRYADSFEAQVQFHEAFDTFPQDGAVAFFKAMKDKFGFVDHQGQMSFFGKRPPEYMTVKIGPNESIQVPWGQFGLPGYEGLEIHVGTHPVKDTFHFCISGVVKKKDKAVIDDLVERIRNNLKNHSIYKSKAISLKFSENFDPESFSPDDVAPEFLDLASINADELVLSENLQRTVEDHLFSPVEKTELCRRFGTPLRRGVLLAGTYGVGKTLTAQIQAQKATRNGWTFIYLKDVNDLAEGLRVARQYAPSVVFAEDIDSVVSGDERTDDINEVLNTIDGIELKGKDIMVVLTTNHVDKITPAMMRPGRIDIVIEMTPPDAKAAEKLLRVYGKSLIDPNTDLSKAGQLLAGQRPAMIAEVVQRSKLSAITRMAVNETKMVLIGDDLVAAAISMKAHMALVDRDQNAKPHSTTVIGIVDLTKNGKNGASSQPVTLEA